MTQYSLADLHESDRHIAGVKRRISKQKALIIRLQLIGISTKDAEDLLRLLEELLVILHQHRASIVTAISEAK